MPVPRRPIGDVLAGLEIPPLEPGDTPVEAFVLVKVLTADGHTSWSSRPTNMLNDEELLGALIVQAEVLRHRLTSYWIGDDAP